MANKIIPEMNINVAITTDIIVNEYAIHAVSALTQVNQVTHASSFCLMTKASKHPDRNIAASTRTLAIIG